MILTEGVYIFTRVLKIASPPIRNRERLSPRMAICMWNIHATLSSEYRPFATTSDAMPFALNLLSRVAGRYTKCVATYLFPRSRSG